MKSQITKLNFTGQNIYVGIDVHKKEWKVAIMTIHHTHKIYSQPPSAKVLSNYLKRTFPGGTYFSVYEAGCFGFWIHRELISQGINNIIVNPADIPTTDKEKRHKEDRRDSNKLAKTLRSQQLEAIYIPSKENLQDRLLLRIRRTLVKDLTRNKNRIKGHLTFFNVKIPKEFMNNNTHWSKRFMSWLDSVTISDYNNGGLLAIIKQTHFLRQSLLEINREIVKLSNNEKYKRKVDLLIGIPGIGRYTAMLLLTEIEKIDRFCSDDKFHSYLGLIPQTNSSSDTYRVGDITVRQNKQLRSTLVECAWIAVRKDPALIYKYNELVKRMKPSKAIIRITKSLSNRIRHILKHEVEYQYSII
jgi:transposase